jgi:hypothetical protein
MQMYVDVSCSAMGNFEKTKFWNDAVASDDLPLDVDLPSSLIHAYLILEEADCTSQQLMRPRLGQTRLSKLHQISQCQA